MTRLMLIGFAIVEMGLLGIGLKYGVSPLLYAISLLHPLVFIGAYFVLRQLCFSKVSVEVPLSITSVLTGIGLIILYRVDSAAGTFSHSAYAYRQLVALLVGTVIMLAVAWVFRQPHRMERIAPWLLSGGMVLVGLTFVFGREAGGSKAWLEIGGWNLQPSEILKFGLVVFLATYLARFRRLYGDKTPPDWWQKPRMISAYLTPLLCMEATALILVVLQKDLGMGLIYFSLFLLLLYEATSQAGIVGLGAGIGSVGLVLAGMIFPHVGRRLSLWIHPWGDPSGSGYQMVQSLLAVRSGGLLGRGIGEGLPLKIPAAHTDFVFSLWAEEMGFYGCIALSMLFLWLILYSLNCEKTAEHPAMKIAAVGVAGLFGLQTLIIIGGCIGLLPLTGVTLPLVSYGGSSLISSLAAVGLLVAVGDGGDEPNG